jgi:thioredoxin reductase (NADPH)
MRFNSSQENLELLGLPVRSAEGEKPTREDYLAYLRDFVRYHGLEVNSYEEVTAIRGGKGEFVVQTRRKSGEERSYGAGRVVLALGSTELPRRLGVPGEDLPHVSHYFDDPHRYYGQRVAIVGGRNSAAEAALRLTHMGARVTLVHRRAAIDLSHLKYWIGPELSGMIERGTIQAEFDSTVERITPEALVVRTRAGGEKILACDFVLLLVGYVPDYTLIDMLGIETHKEQREPRVDPDTLETSRPGVYCAGTLVAGAQNPYRVFIENALDHPYKIADAVEAEDA